MRGDLPPPPFPGQTVGGGVPDAPRNLPLTAIPRAATRGGVKTPPYKQTRKPPPTLTPGRACPAPTARRPGNGCPCQLYSVSISPSVGRGAPTPPRPSATVRSWVNRRGRRPRRPAEASGAANNSPCLPPWGKVAPQGRMRGRLALPPIPGQTVGGGVPDAPRRLAPTSFPGVPPAEGSRPLPTDRTIDGCPRNPPGRACPAPTA